MVIVILIVSSKRRLALSWLALLRHVRRSHLLLTVLLVPNRVRSWSISPVLRSRSVVAVASWIHVVEAARSWSSLSVAVVPVVPVVSIVSHVSIVAAISVVSAVEVETSLQVVAALWLLLLIVAVFVLLREVASRSTSDYSSWSVSSLRSEVLVIAGLVAFLGDLVALASRVVVA